MNKDKWPKIADLTSDVILIRTSVNKEDNVLLIKRKNNPYKEMWALPGGFLEMSETFKDAAYRELEEETGLKSGVANLRFLCILDAVDRDPRGRTIDAVFMGSISEDQVIDVKAGDDAAEARWFSMDDLPSLAFDHNLAIKKAKEELGYYD